MTKEEIDSAFPELYQFLGGCFGEDWYDDATRPEERLVGGPEPEPHVYKRNISKFATQADANAHLALHQLDVLLARQWSADQLQEVLTRGFLVNYWPRSNSGYRPWLEEVRVTLAECLQGSRGPDV
jgi:hypothetical protein